MELKTLFKGRNTECKVHGAWETGAQLEWRNQVVRFEMKKLVGMGWLGGGA